MRRVYRALLQLYPASYREQFSAEMIAVFAEVQAETAARNVFARGIFAFREATGLLCGAIHEHVHVRTAHLRLPISSLPFPIGRFTMRNGFRFPKSTPILMTLILACLVWAIEKGKAIADSLPHVNPAVGPIQPGHLTFLPVAALVFAFFYAAGILGWAILFALRRSGVHRLAEMSVEPK